MKHLYITLILISIFSSAISAQELNAKLNINTQNIQTSSREVFSSLESSLKDMFNEQRWTDISFGRNEKIDCTITLIITEMPTEATFVGEIQITARRPVYNSTYLTPLFNYKDSQLDFSYIMGQSLDFNSNDIRDNLLAVVAFYTYVVLGLDFDSFSKSGGQPYFTKAMDIANRAQSLNTRGWESFTGGKASRYDLAVALTDDSYKYFHEMWYAYHRSGLDEMAANPARGRINVMETIKALETLQKSRPTSPLLVLFAEAKLEELVKICSAATAEEKKEMKSLLLKIYPAKSNIINTLN